MLLIATNMIDPTKASKADAESSRRQQTEDSDLDSADDVPSRPQGGRGTGTVNARTQKNIRTGTVGRDSDDSDFDL